jgi:hypothetical protein
VIIQEVSNVKEIEGLLNGAHRKGKRTNAILLQIANKRHSGDLALYLPSLCTFACNFGRAAADPSRLAEDVARRTAACVVPTSTRASDASHSFVLMNTRLPFEKTKQGKGAAPCRHRQLALSTALFTPGS